MKSASVSYNQDSHKANKEVEQYLDRGYLVVESYGHDWDCGQILKKGESDKEKKEVLVLHKEHIKRCEESYSMRNKITK